jgi:hypothetical protein
MTIQTQPGTCESKSEQELNKNFSVDAVVKIMRTLIRLFRKKQMVERVYPVYQVHRLRFQDVDEHGCYIRLGTDDGQLALLVRCVNTEERAQMLERIAAVVGVRNMDSEFSVEQDV